MSPTRAGQAVGGRRGAGGPGIGGAPGDNDRRADVARAVVLAISQPDDVDFNEIVLRPTRQEY
jgi:hypothetical protein